MNDTEHVDPADTMLIHWPRITLGEEIAIKGVRFTIARINRSNVVLSPVTSGKQRASEVINKLLRGRRDQSQKTP